MWNKLLLNLLDWTCRFLAVSVASMLSPTWYLLERAFSPYLNLNRLTHTAHPEIICRDFLQYLNLHPEALLRLLPTLVLCLLVSLVVLLLSSRIGVVFSRWVIRSLKSSGFFQAT